MRKARTVAVAAVLFSFGLAGCSRHADEPGATRTVSPSSRAENGNGISSTRLPGGEMPAWLDLYRTKTIVNVATVDNVVIVTFETLGQRDEVFGHYTGEFGGEENFVSFRDNRDIISFLREGYGVKITLLDQSKNLWTLEYHKQAI